MSDTKRGGKEWGYQYWSARPGNKSGHAVPSYRGGKTAKKMTHRLERIEGKKAAKEQS